MTPERLYGHTEYPCQKTEKMKLKDQNKCKFKKNNKLAIEYSNFTKLTPSLRNACFIMFLVNHFCFLSYI